MPDRTVRIVVAAVLVLLALSVAQPHLQPSRYSAEAPRAVAARGDRAQSGDSGSVRTGGGAAVAVTRVGLAPSDDPAPLALLAIGSALAAERPARSRMCPEDLPEGVRLPAQPGCGAPAPEPKAPRRGFHDAGDGTTVQIGGRVGADFGARR